MKLRLIALVSILLLSGCGWHATFKQNDRQGQLLPDKAISQLKKGMSPSEVTHLIGSPLVYNLNDERWEYIQYSKIKGVVKKNKHLVLTFRNGRLDKIEKY